MLRKWKIGSMFGISVYLHPTWFLLPLLVLLSGPLAAGPFKVALLVGVFTCVVLHEYGHALTARAFGIGTRDITLYPIGGVARLERMPEKPSQELLIALAGPAVNVVIFSVLAPPLLILYLRYGFTFIAPEKMMSASVARIAFNYFAALCFVNVCLVVFNMLPTFPMDGGRVLRALLSWVVKPVPATTIAVWVGRAVMVCVALVIWQFQFQTSSISLLVVGLFVIIAGEAELRAVRQREVDPKGSNPRP